MITSHHVEHGHTFITDGGSELYIIVDDSAKTASVSYRRDRDHEKVTIEAQTVDELSELLTEANTLIRNLGQIG